MIAYRLFLATLLLVGLALAGFAIYLASGADIRKAQMRADAEHTACYDERYGRELPPVYGDDC